jgi:ferredoxin-nitrate reductase
MKEPWGEHTPFGQGEEWPVRVDQFLEQGISEDDIDRWVQTASILHSNGDALDIAVKEGRIVGVRGRGVDRVNKGRVDPKDLFGWQANNAGDRLRKPLVRENGELVEASWGEAMGRIVERSQELLEEKRALAFGFYTTGQLFLEEYVAAHTMGFEELKNTVAEYPPETVAEICAVPAEQIRQAAGIIGESERLLSTVLQGFYQSQGATAASCQVNNIHLIRGMIGKPGCGVLQMNGQPTAQNTRECGANGDLPAFRNWDNVEHIEELAELWNVERMKLPHWASPTHAMQIWRYAEQGSISFLWISATNPAVSLPQLSRIRSILEDENLFVVVQDIFLTETAQYADVVLPAATWGEKTGTFTNADRTVHLSEKAVEPPGEAKSDLEIFLDYARRMDFRDKDGQPLIKWDDPESAFGAWKECSRGRPCDYTGITYEKLRDSSGVQWPCNNEHPDGTERLYADDGFNTETDYCETYGRDLLTGAEYTEMEHKAIAPAGRAFLLAAEYQPPHEEPREEYPFSYITGRTIYHFHTRTKTARAPQLQNAAPDVWVELSPADAESLGVEEGDMVRVESPRGQLEAKARISGIKEGVVFAPFHYGYFDEPDGQPRAANELTITEWDPASKQPLYKIGAVRVTKVADARGTPAPAPTTTASAPTSGVSVPETVGGEVAEVEEIVGKE